MFLKELDLGNETKCTCTSCRGTGVYKGVAERDGLAVVCYSCNGKGYYTLKLYENVHLVQDEKTGVVYKVNNDIIVDCVSLFDKLQRRDDVNYVTYATEYVLSPRYLFEHGASEINVISYREFLQGKMPLPMMQYTCPRQISQNYGNTFFDNNCGFGSFSNCSKFGTQECWEKFYGDAETIEEKQKVLRKIMK